MKDPRVESLARILVGYSTKVGGIQTTEAGPCNYWDFKSAWLNA